jgi:SAM-dependent methyltransferase
MSTEHLQNEQYYNEDYFNWQKNMGAFGGWAELIKFEDHIRPNMNVIDFGCGGGFLLNNIKCKDKIDVARKTIEAFGIQSFKYIEEVPDEWADCIISNHALEHVPEPLKCLQLLKTKLKKGGKIIFVVPYDTYAFKPNDINYHLYSWSPMNLGNLFTEAGFKVSESIRFTHRWPPYYQKIAKIFGKSIFNLICRMYGFWMRNVCAQSRVIAQKVD